MSLVAPFQAPGLLFYLLDSLHSLVLGHSLLIELDLLHPDPPRQAACTSLTLLGCET